MKKLLLIIIVLVSGLMPLIAQPVITNQPVNQTAVLGGNATFSVLAAGTGPLVYQWQFNATNVFTNGIISTVVGGSAGFYGDGGPATNAGLSQPCAVAMDTLGNMFIADMANNRIRKVDTNGVISTVAGNSTQGFSGDGDAATNASLKLPYAVAADSLGDVFIADNGNARIRKVDTNGVISTVAGGGSGADGVLATNAILKSPAGVAVDMLGNLFIAEKSNNRIRKVDTNGYISTVAGTGSIGNTGDGGPATSAKLYNPYGVALDGSGNLFISSTYAIRKVDTNGIISTVAGTGTGGFSGDGGLATNATMWNAQGISVDTFGYIYIADSSSDRIRQVDANGIITTVAGIGSGSFGAGDGIYATNASVYAPEGVALDNSGNLLIADTQNNRIRKVITGRNPVLTLKNILAKSAGNYQVIVTGTNGSVTSSNASLTILFPPSVTTQPTNFVRVVNGSSASLNVSVTGDGPFGYQWFTSSGRTAMAWPNVFAGSVQMVFVIDPGAGYVSTPQVHFIGGSGSGATATATVQSGSVVLINMNNHGSGYATVPPTIQIDPPPTSNTPLPNQTNATLTLPSVTSTDATNYFVVVTNNYGSVTSSTVFLTVFLSPQNFSAQNVVTGLQMNLTGTPSFPYVLQSATNLTSPINWKSIRTNYSDVSGNWQFTDTNMNGDQKFYRAMGQ